jgi:hypothetical protein
MHSTLTLFQSHLPVMIHKLFVFFGPWKLKYLSLASFNIYDMEYTQAELFIIPVYPTKVRLLKLSANT